MFVVIFFLTIQTTKCYFEDGFHDTKIYLLEELSAGHTIDGPAIIVDKNRSVACGLHSRLKIMKVSKHVWSSMRLFSKTSTMTPIVVLFGKS